jgi:type II secretory pathway component GspD/PulD (secretin)
MRNIFYAGVVLSSILAARAFVLADDVEVKVAAPVAAPAPAMSGGTMVITGPNGPIEIKPGEQIPGMSKPGDAPGGPGGPDKNKPGEGEKKPGEGKPGEGKPEEAIKPLQHPTDPPKPPNPDEFKVQPNKNGEYSFNFNGQPWPGVLNWLAQISNMSLDWQEMPGDFLNLSTQRPYKVAEVRDLINRHLLARGYTLLSRGECLMVVNVKKVDLSLVPRVEPEALKSHQPYEFVKVSFSLSSMTAEAAADELKPMASKNGQLIPLKLTNRLEAVDAVANLEEIYALLKTEQSPSVPQRSVQEFTLQYARADEVREQLEALLGKEKMPGMPRPGEGGQGGMSPEMVQAMQQQAEMMSRRGGGPEGGQPGQPGKLPSAPSPMSFVVNPHKNSIIAYAPPDKMALIGQIIKTLDVPTGSQSSLLANVGRTQVYRLTGIEPETLKKTLREIGNLDPTTTIQTDKKNNSLIVFGPMADHVIIGELVRKLSGAERQFAVRRLRRLAAESVAGTVEFMINGDKKDKSNRNPFSFFDRYSSSDSNQPTNSFRVDADIENNQLILYANDIELSDVDNLLRKLGEIPMNEGPASKRRLIQAGGGDEAQELLGRIQEAWESISPNPLEVKPTEPREKTPEPTPNAEPSAENREVRPLVKFAELSGDPVSEPSPEPRHAAPAKLPAKAPPVKVEIRPDGRIAATSDDPQALDLFEDLASQLADSKKDYKTFKLKYCLASSVALTLEDFFKEDKKSGRAVPRWIEYEYGVSNSSDDDKAGRLSKKRTPKFIADSDTNTILVQGADAKQLQTIEELIALYDKPLPSDAQSVRKTETIQLEYSKAQTVADTVKDVYRDLLSKNDKAFGKNDRDQSRGFFFGFDGDDSSKKEQKMPKFTGLLSIGVDEVSNSIVLSAPAYLFDQVKRMIEDLDMAAAPASQMRVIQLGPGMRGPAIRKQLMEALGQKSPQEEESEKTKPTDENAPPKNGKKNGRGGAKNGKEST